MNDKILEDTMRKYIKKIAEKEIYNYSPTKGFVQLWDFSKSNHNQEARIEAVTTVASLSYGNEMAKDPKKLWDYLREQGHSSVFEFIRFPVYCVEENGKYIGYNIAGSLRVAYIPPNILVDSHSTEWHKETIATFKIKVPLFVRSQYHRHRCGSFLEMSRRYVKPDKVKFEYWKPANNREIDNLIKLSEKVYRDLINSGYKPEVARSVLPQSLYTIFWVMKDYKCARNFYVERYSTYAQEQIREVAKAELELLYKHQPEFLGQYIKIMGDDKFGIYRKGYEIKILDIQEHYRELKEVGWNKEVKIIYCEFGNNNYYAKFSLEEGLFVGKILKAKLNCW